MTQSNLKSLTCLLLGILLGHSQVHAAPLRFLPWDSNLAARKIGLSNSKGILELDDLHPHKRSQPYMGSGNGVPVQLVALDRKDPEGNPAKTEITIPLNLVSPLVLIIPDEKNPTGLRTFVVDDSVSGFSWGAFRFINACGKPLLISQDNKVTPLPASWTPVDLSPSGEARNIGIQLVAQDDLKKIRYSAFWEYDPDIRKLVFIVPNLEGSAGAIYCKIIPENRRTLDDAVPSDE